VDKKKESAGKGDKQQSNSKQLQSSKQFEAKQFKARERRQFEAKQFKKAIQIRSNSKVEKEKLQCGLDVEKVRENLDRLCASSATKNVDEVRGSPPRTRPVWPQ